MADGETFKESASEIESKLKDIKEEEQEEEEEQEDEDELHINEDDTTAATDDVAFVAALVSESNSIPSVAPVPKVEPTVAEPMATEDPNLFFVDKKANQPDGEESDSDSSDWMSDDEPQIRKKQVVMSTAGLDSDDEEVGPESMRTKNEILPVVDEFPDPFIPEGDEIIPLGHVYAIVDKTIVVQSTIRAALDMDSVLCFENRRILGRVFETFGPVAQPCYSVLFSSSEKIDRTVVTNGAAVFYVPNLSKFVFADALKKIKGSDASNLYDEEIGDEEQEFSDDEKETEFKRAQKPQKGKKGSKRDKVSMDTNDGEPTTDGSEERQGYRPHQSHRPRQSSNYSNESGAYGSAYRPLQRPPHNSASMPYPNTSTQIHFQQNMAYPPFSPPFPSQTPQQQLPQQNPQQFSHQQFPSQQFHQPPQFSQQFHQQYAQQQFVAPAQAQFYSHSMGNLADQQPLYPVPSWQNQCNAPLLPNQPFLNPQPPFSQNSSPFGQQFGSPPFRPQNPNRSYTSGRP